MWTPTSRGFSIRWTGNGCCGSWNGAWETGGRRVRQGIGFAAGMAEYPCPATTVALGSLPIASGLYRSGVDVREVHLRTERVRAANRHSELPPSRDASRSGGSLAISGKRDMSAREDGMSFSSSGASGRRGSSAKRNAGSFPIRVASSWSARPGQASSASADAAGPANGHADARGVHELCNHGGAPWSPAWSWSRYREASMSRGRRRHDGTC